MVKKVSESVRRDFEVFAKGVERLEQIRQELGSLDTKKYGAEISSIKSKLNNVSYLPEIEKELIDLKAKINGTYKEKKKINQAHIAIDKKINELKNKIPKDHYRIHKKIEQLEKQIPNKDKFQRKLKYLERELKEKIPTLKRELESFKEFINQRKKEEDRKKEILKMIDPKFNFEVNDKFNLTLNEIKTELYEKIHKRELNVQKELHDDLEERKLNFKKQYEDLEKKFNKEYTDRVKTSLREEVENKLKDLLNRKAEILKRKLEDDDIKKLELEKQKLNDSFKEIFIDKTKRLKFQETELKNIEKQKLLEIEEKRKALEKLKNKLLSDSNKKMEIEKRNIQEKLKGEKESLRVNEIKRMTELQQLENKNLADFKLDKSNLISLKKKFLLENSKKSRELERKLANLVILRKKIEQDNIEKLASEEKKLKDTKKQKLSEIVILKNNLKKSRKLFQLEKIKKLNQLKERIANQDKIVKAIVGEELTEKLNIKKKFLENYFRLNLEKEKKSLKQHFDEEILVHQASLDNKMHEHLTQETKKVHDDYSKKLKEEEADIHKIKQTLLNKKDLLSNIKNTLILKMKEIKNDEEGYENRLKENLEKKKHEEIENAVRKQSKIIKERLKKEFGERLKLEIHAKEADFEKKKSELALEIQNKARQLFV